MITYHVSDADAATAAIVALDLPEPRARQLVTSYPGLRGLAYATASQVRSACGCTQRQADRVLAAFRLARVAGSQARDAARALRHPEHVAERVRRLIGSEPVECFTVLLLDARQRVIDAVIVARGTLSQVDVHPREVYAPAIQSRAHSIIVAHNHPSEDATPSDADFELTRRIRDVGALVGIPLLDHIVVTPHEHVSLASLGMVGA